jgi:hypothetical protein
MDKEAPVRGVMDLLNLTWHMPQGSRGTDDDPSNPLSRAVNRLFEEGQSFIGITLCFLGDLNRATQHWYTQPIETLIRLSLRRLPLANRVWSELRLSSIRHSPLRWLGTFIFSAGKRVIFSKDLPFLPLEFRAFKDNHRNRYTIIKRFRLTTFLSKKIAANGILQPRNQKLIQAVGVHIPWGMSGFYGSV